MQNFAVSITIDNLAQLEKLHRAMQLIQGDAKRPIVQAINIDVEKPDRNLKRKLKEWESLAKKGLTVNVGGGGARGMGGTLNVKLVTKELERKLDALTKALPLSMVGKGATRQEALRVKVMDTVKIDTKGLNTAVTNFTRAANTLQDTVNTFAKALASRQTNRDRVVRAGKLGDIAKQEQRLSEFTKAGGDSSKATYTQMRDMVREMAAMADALGKTFGTKFRARMKQARSDLRASGMEGADVEEALLGQMPRYIQSGLTLKAAKLTRPSRGGGAAAVGVDQLTMAQGISSAVEQSLTRLIQKIPERMGQAAEQAMQKVVERATNLTAPDMGGARQFAVPLSDKRRAQLKMQQDLINKYQVMQQNGRTMSAADYVPFGGAGTDVIDFLKSNPSAGEIKKFLQHGSGNRSNIRGIMRAGITGSEYGVGYMPQTAAETALFHTEMDKARIAMARAPKGGMTTAVLPPAFAAASGKTSAYNIDNYKQLYKEIYALNTLTLGNLIKQFETLGGAIAKAVGPLEKVQDTVRPLAQLRAEIEMEKYRTQAFKERLALRQQARGGNLDPDLARIDKMIPGATGAMERDLRGRAYAGSPSGLAALNAAALVQASKEREQLAKQDEKAIRYADARARMNNPNMQAVAGSGALGVPTGASAFFKILKNRLGSLSRDIESFDRFSAQLTEAEALNQPVGQKSRAIKEAGIRISSGQNMITNLMGMASQAGLPGMEQFSGLSEHMTNLTDRRMAMQMQLNPMFYAQSKSNDDKLRPDLRQRYGALANRMGTDLASKGVSVSELNKLKVAEDQVRGSVLGAANALITQYEAMNKNDGVLADMASKFKQLAIYAGAGFFVYGAIQQIRNMFGELVKLEAQLTRIQGILGESGTTSRSFLFSGIMQAAQDFGTDIQKVAQVFQGFAQSGLTRSQAMTETRSTLAAEVGGGLDAETAQNVAIATRNISGGRVSSLDMFNRIARIEAATPVTGQEIASGISRVGSLFGQFQPQRLGTMDSFDALIGSLTKIVETTRVSGEQAATSLKFMLSRLTSPAVGKTLQNKFGIRLADETGLNLRPVTDILSDVSKTYQQLQASGQGGKAAQLIQAVAGNRQINQAVALFSNFNRAMELASESSLAFGDIQRRVSLQMETTQVKFQKFGNALFSYFATLVDKSGLLDIAKYGLDKGASVLGSAQSHPVTALLGTAVLPLAASFLAGRLSNVIGGFRGAAAGIAASRVAGMAGYVGTGVAGAAEGAIANFAGTAAGQSLASVRGLGALQKVLGAIGGLFGGLAIFAVIAGLGALFALVKKAGEDRAKLEELYSIHIPTRDEIMSGDLGKEYTETGRRFGKSPDELMTITRTAVVAARATVLNSPEFSNLPATTRNNLFSSSEATRTTDPRLYKAFNAAYLQSIKGSGLQGFEQLSPEDQQGIADQLLRQSLQILSGPASVASSTLNEKGRNLLTELGTTYSSDTGLMASLRTGRYNPRGGEAIMQNAPLLGAHMGAFGGAAGLTSTLNSTLGLGLPEIRNLNYGMVKLNGQVDLSTEIFNRMNTSGKSLGEVLDDINDTYFTKRAGMTAVQQAQVDTNLRQLQGQTRAEFNRAYDVSTGQLIPKNASGMASGEFPGARFLQTRLEMLSKILDEKVTSLRNAGQQGAAEALSVTNRALMDFRNRGSAMARFLEVSGGRASIRDRLVELLGQYTVRNDQISGMQAVSGRTGLYANIPTQRLQATEQLTEGLLAVRSQIELDLAKVEARRHNLVGDVTATLTDNPNIFGGDENSPERQASRRENLGRLITQAYTGSDTAKQLDMQANLLRSAIRTLSENQDVFSKLPPDTKEFLTRHLGDTNKDLIRNYKEILDTVLSINASQRDLVNGLARENMERQRSTQLDADRLKSTHELGQLRRGTSIQLADIMGGPGGGAGLRLQDVRTRAEEDRVANIQSFMTSMADLQAGIDNQTFGGDAQAERDKFYNTFLTNQGQQSIQYNKELISAWHQDWTQFLTSLNTSIVQAVDNSTRGFTDVFGSYDSFTTGRQAQSIPRRKFDIGNMASRLITPVGDQISTSTAQAGQNILFGPGGALFNALKDTVGTPIQLQYAQMEANLIRTAHIEGITMGFDEATGSKTAGGGKLTTTTEMTGRGGAGRYAMLGGMLLGSFGGAALGEALGKGRYSYASTGSSIGSSLGPNLLKRALPSLFGKMGKLGAFGGPIGAIAGGLLGGLLGGLFGKKAPRPIEQLSVLERIERNTRGTVTALENQNRQLFNLDSRLLNVPSGFNVPGYRPMVTGSGPAGTSTIENNQQFVFNIHSADPEGVRREIETMLRQDSRKFGVFSSTRY